MDVTALLNFAPLVIGVILAYHLIFKQKLPSENLGKIISYFVGILIVFFAVSWLITTFLAGWATELLEAGTTSTEWQQFIDASEGVVEDVFVPENNMQPTATTPSQPAQVVATPPVSTVPETNLQEAESAVISYTVQPGDTLTRIAQRYGTTVNAIVELNRLASPNQILVGQVLLIPDPN